MPKYEELNETQQRLYDQLQTAMKEGENIIDLLLRSSKIDLQKLIFQDCQKRICWKFLLL